MIDEVKNTIRSKMGKAYLYLFCCGNVKRFEREKVRRALQDENDILKEEFDRRKCILASFSHSLNFRAQRNQESLVSQSKVSFG